MLCLHGQSGNPIICALIRAKSCQKFASEAEWRNRSDSTRFGAADARQPSLSGSLFKRVCCLRLRHLRIIKSDANKLIIRLKTFDCVTCVSYNALGSGENWISRSGSNINFIFVQLWRCVNGEQRRSSLWPPFFLRRARSFHPLKIETAAMERFNYPSRKIIHSIRNM